MSRDEAPAPDRIDRWTAEVRSACETGSMTTISYRTIAKRLLALADREVAERVAEDRMGIMLCTAEMPTPNMVRARLVADGWTRHEMTYAGYAAYSKFRPDFNDTFELVLPDGMGERWQLHVEQALRTLAGLEDREDDDAPDRPIGDIAAEIIAAAPRPPAVGTEQEGGSHGG